MTALPTNFLNILRNKLEKEFVPHLPELLNKERPKADQDKKQLSRAFSGFVLHKMLNIGIADAAKSVVDDFDDNGLDAIHYEATSKTLYLVQTKFREREQFDEGDAIRFRSGADLLLGQRYDRFNANVQCRKDELNNAFDEAERIQLVVAYIGTGFSAHANAALKELIADEDHHEFGRLQPDVAEYGPDKVQADLLAEQSVGVVNDSLRLSKWQHLGGHRDTHIGVALLSDLVALHKKHNKALYERNIRYFLGSRESDVNKSIQETLRTAPDEFFYLNNGVTALADLVEAPQGTKANKLLRLRGLSVINGAQTISSAAEFVAQNPLCDISKAKVLVTVIKADSEGAFGRSVTRARNHQNPVSTGNFASLDPRQEELRRELNYLGYSYHYRPEATPRNAEVSASIITIEQAMKALALFEVDSRYPYWLKNEISRFQNAESSEYKSLFTQALTGAQLVNKVKFFRFVRDVLSSNAVATRGAEGLFYRHGIFVVAAAMAKKFRNRVNEADVLKQEQINQLLSIPLDECRQHCWDTARPIVGQGRSVLTFFQNQGNTVRLLDACMATTNGLVQSDAYQALKNVADKNEAFPQERVFRYLTTQAPQI
ncbi:abortive phage resistance protein [Duganella sp. FT94W]|uniref:Abortive phage resistance protein n=1 Tax=Duganella lactea TaxID=2692173 RepID=A0ABW9V3A3_9BURK|nr:AIPR family protein [Duganella lactea]MYM34055.1 abortive phage resistance protein [Duganella lactea]